MREGRKKEASKGKQTNKAKQHSTYTSVYAYLTMPVDREIESRRCVLFILIHIQFQPTEVGNEKEVKEVCTTSYTMYTYMYLYVYWPSCVYIHVHVYVPGQVCASYNQCLQ